MSANRFARWFVLAAGGMDFLTGIGLVLAPAKLLPVMGVAVPGVEALVFLRWVGVFVAAVGFIYLWAWLRPVSVLWATLELTTFIRLAVGLFCTVAIARGWLAVDWVSVPVTDLTLALAQVGLLIKGGRT
jgi:hypothetical protein